MNAPESPASMPANQPASRFPRTVSIKTALAVLVVVALAGLAYYYRGVFVAATVNGSPISRLAVIDELEKQSGKAALDTLINARLIDLEAKKLSINVTESEIDEEIKTIEDSLAEQDMTLDAALAAENLSMAQLRSNILSQKKADKILGDKLNVSDEEVDGYIVENEVTLEAGKEADQREQIRSNLRQQKFSQEITAWFNEARTTATINRYVWY